MAAGQPSTTAHIEDTHAAGEVDLSAEATAGPLMQAQRHSAASHAMRPRRPGRSCPRLCSSAS
jgi:hypothetical protein